MVNDIVVVCLILINNGECTRFFVECYQRYHSGKYFESSTLHPSSNRIVNYFTIIKILGTQKTFMELLERLIVFYEAFYGNSRVCRWVYYISFHWSHYFTVVCSFTALPKKWILSINQFQKDVGFLYHLSSLLFFSEDCLIPHWPHLPFTSWLRRVVHAGGSDKMIEASQNLVTHFNCYFNSQA